MNISDIKDLMTQFDQSSLREFSYKNGEAELVFSKNKQSLSGASLPTHSVPASGSAVQTITEDVATAVAPKAQSSDVATVAEGDLVESPLVGVAYLSPAPDKPAFVSVGDAVKKGQTLLIVEAMKVMNEVPAPKDGVVTEILVTNEEVVDFGKGLVRIK